jgi:hypothetical protein
MTMRMICRPPPGFCQHTLAYLGLHCKPGKAYMRLKTASCKAGLGTTHMCSLEICTCSLLIHQFDDEWDFTPFLPCPSIICTLILPNESESFLF